MRKNNFIFTAIIFILATIIFNNIVDYGVTQGNLQIGISHDIQFNDTHIIRIKYKNNGKFIYKISPYTRMKIYTTEGIVEYYLNDENLLYGGTTYRYKVKYTGVVEKIEINGIKDLWTENICFYEIYNKNLDNNYPLYNGYAYTVINIVFVFFVFFSLNPIEFYINKFKKNSKIS